MEFLKIKLHPLFFAVGILSALFGGLPVFLICALTALLHECGHIFYAAKLGVECTEIKLMPYGAAAMCDIEDISRWDEVKLALAGPLVNLALCVAVAGLWWFFPDTYAFTDLIFYANAAMLLLNLMPAFPLDGGRVARGMLACFFPEKAVGIVLRIMQVLVATALVCIYFFALKNLSLLIVAGFLALSVLEKSPPVKKINYAAKKKKRGREIRYVVMDESATYRDALKFADSGKYLIIQIYGDVFLDEISEDELYERLQSHGLYEKIIS